MKRTLGLLALLSLAAGCASDDSAVTPESLIVSPTAESSPTTSSAPPTAAVPTIGPTSLPTGAIDRLTVAPSPAVGGDTITVTFQEGVLYNRRELLLYADGTSRFLIGDDSIQSTDVPVTVNGYDMTPSDDPLVFRLPTDIPAGDYVACVAQADIVADGPVCGPFVIADQGQAD